MEHGEFLATFIDRRPEGNTAVSSSLVLPLAGCVCPRKNKSIFAAEDYIRACCFLAMDNIALKDGLDEADMFTVCSLGLIIDETVLLKRQV